jgi:hypothetical protein
MKMISANRRIAEVEAENAALRAENERLAADQDYIAMMTGVELDDEGEEANEPEV